MNTSGSPLDQPWVRRIEPGKLSLRVIREELAAIVADRSADPALHYLDGTRLYGADDAARLPLPDNLHPGDDVNALIADRFAALAFGPATSLAPH